MTKPKVTGARLRASYAAAIKSEEARERALQQAFHSAVNGVFKSLRKDLDNKMAELDKNLASKDKKVAAQARQDVNTIWLSKEFSPQKDGVEISAPQDFKIMDSAGFKAFERHCKKLDVDCSAPTLSRFGRDDGPYHIQMGVSPLNGFPLEASGSRVRRRASGAKHS